MSDVMPRPADSQPPRWCPLSLVERRVVGVLVEKAKTTPEQYPMSLNALRAGCNQKSNRDPMLDLESEDIEEALEHLRELGAVSEVIGGGRVSRFRHMLYEWLGVDKVELAVMAELLLRGAQTEGELRGRAARMHPIADVAALRPVLVSLKGKGLMVALTPEGRGHVVTHALYKPEEFERIKSQHGAQGTREAAPAIAERPGPVHAEVFRPREASPASPERANLRFDGSTQRDDTSDRLRQELSALRAELAELRSEVESISDQLKQQRDEFDSLRQSLGG